MNSLYSLGTREVEYRPVSSGQKCVWCVNDATQEAVQRQGNITAISRCCGDLRCMCLSAERVDHQAA
jgi:hypothetical protein